MSDDPQVIARRDAKRSALLWVGIVLVALGLPALVIYGLRENGGPRMLVPIVGAGALARVSGADAPEGYRFDVDVRASEDVDETHRRGTEAIGHWPDVIVIGLDARQLRGGEEAEARARTAILRLTQQAENATAVPVVLGFVPPPDADPALTAAIERASEWWRQDLCRAPGALRICVEVHDEADVVGAVRAAVIDAGERHRELEASTQVGR